MGRKSAVSRLPPAAKKHLEKLLREGRLTLDEMYAEMREKFPQLAEAGELPSRSGLGRYQIGFQEMAGRMREISQASETLVGELGDGFGEKAGALLAQAVTTLATNAALRAHNTDEVSIKEVADLARAARAAMMAQQLSRKERQAVAEEAKRQLLEQQEANLKEAVRSQGMDEAQADFWRRKVLGVVGG